MQSQYTSEELVHLVGAREPQHDEVNYRTLGLILNSRQVQTKRREPGEGTNGYITRWHGTLADETRIEPNVTCYADIPRESLGRNVSVYGRFGVAFQRDFLVFKGARPVMYFPKGPAKRPRGEFFAAVGSTTVLRDIDAVHLGLMKLGFCEVNASKVGGWQERRD